MIINKSILRKWKKAGLLDGLDNLKDQMKLAQLLENASLSMIKEQNDKEYIISLIRRVYIKLSENQKFHVMKLPVEIIKDKSRCTYQFNINAKFDPLSYEGKGYSRIDEECGLLSHLTDQIVNWFNEKYPTQKLALYRLIQFVPTINDPVDFTPKKSIATRFAVIE